MTLRYLLDTDIIIDALRGCEKAMLFIEQHDETLAVSILSIAELYAGVKGQAEEKQLSAFLALFPKMLVNETIARNGGVYRNRYGKSHGTGLVDALLAATAQEEHLTLTTLNRKHYPMLERLHIPYKKE